MIIETIPGTRDEGTLTNVVSNSPLLEHVPGQTNTNFPNGVEHTKQVVQRIYTTSSVLKRKASVEIPHTPSPNKRHKFEETRSSDRRLSILLASAVDGIWQIRLLIPTPPSTPTSKIQARGLSPKKNLSRLHSKWRRRLGGGTGCYAFSQDKEAPSRETRAVKPVARPNKHTHQDSLGVSTRPPNLVGKDGKKRKEAGIVPKKQKPSVGGEPDSKQNKGWQKAARAFVSPEARPLATSKSTEFSATDVDAAIAVLTVVTDLSGSLRKPCRELQVDLCAALHHMPHLLTLKGRDEKAELAERFRAVIYEHPESASWGGIESFDELYQQLEGLRKFDRLAEARPMEREAGIFEV
ncbi:hypothetical protein FALBO_12861 [Fusarium albosuccineum]|uniref:Uncharacterized protein n=1 Tax=Fusarium albosuccineum TaxID=1237068 RepID=A0A8H4L122_9HYPO|nr:hypothetical protein FALBO_12861 [Fusarium albosuccineum]